MQKRIALFPGSFDPFTSGHEDIVLRSLALFDEIIIALGHNSKKERYFDADKMIEYIKLAFEEYDNVRVIKYNELTASLAEKNNAGFMIRGLRNTTDFEYENGISQINRYLNNSLETVFLITSPSFAPISSSIIREVHKYGGDVSSFLPYELEE
jgi:pantetheine-phosphate adenylyltransferase